MKCWVINVFNTIKRFIKNGYEHTPDGRTCKIIRPEITEKMIEEITSKKRLEAWSHLSLVARADLLSR